MFISRGGMKVSRYVPASFEDSEAYWINPAGRVLSKVSTHIHAVCNCPVAFGLTEEYLRSVFEKYSEPWASEGNARDEIVSDLIHRGWIRIRYYVQIGDLYLIELNRLSDKNKTFLWAWANSLIQASGGVHKESLVNICEYSFNQQMTEGSVEDLALDKLFSHVIPDNGVILIPIHSEFEFLEMAPYAIALSGGFMVRRETIKSAYLANKISGGEAVLSMCEEARISLDDAHEILRHWNSFSEDEVLSSTGPRTLAEWKLYERAKKMYDGGFSYKEASGVLARESGVSHKRVRDIIGTADEWRKGYFDMGLEPLVISAVGQRRRGDIVG